MISLTDIREEADVAKLKNDYNWRRVHQALAIISLS